MTPHTIFVIAISLIGPAAACALLWAVCLNKKLAERRAVELHWRRMVVRRAQKLNGKILM